MIRTLDDTAVPGPEEVGGKAASLFRLAKLGLRVPGFFVVSADAYAAHPAGRLSEDLRRRILSEWERLGGDGYAWAVRSSSLAEDSAESSFAGVFSTVLDVRGFESVVAAVETCWASHRNPEAEAYRRHRQVAGDDAMAVVVQRMIAAEWAGVCFTADPLTQALSVTVVNATPGTGDALVSGHVNSEVIRIETASGAILGRVGAEGPALPDPLLHEVVDVAGRVAAAYGFPQDIEWAADGEGLWLVQSRPITTVGAVYLNRPLEPWGDAGRPDAPERVWSRVYADEIWTPPISPLFYDVQHIAGIIGAYLSRTGDDGPVPPDVFKYFRAAAYCDVNLLQRMYACLPPVARRPGVYNLLPPERWDALRTAPWRWRAVLRRLRLFEFDNRARWGIDRNWRVLQAAWPDFLRRSRELAAVDLGGLDDAALEAHANQVWAHAGSIGLECGVAVLYYAHDLKLFLSGLLERWCGDGETLYGAVSAGVSGGETVREADQIWDIAQEIRSAGAASRVAAMTWKDVATRASALGLQAAVARFDALRATHGHRGANYKDIVYPRWGDDPELLWAHVVAYLADGPKPSDVNAASGARRTQAQGEILRSLRGPGAPFRRAVLKFLFRYNEIYSGLRDNHRFYYDYVWWMLRRYFLEKGRRSSHTGLLDSAEDVFFLNRLEHAGLQDGSLSPASARERISVRRREWEATKRRTPPKFLRRGYAPDDGWVPPPGSKELSGFGVSPGHARGVARVIHDVADLGRVQPGDVIVARQTDPSWTPAFARAGGLVMETGSVLAHGASLCREFGLPCVTAIERASEYIGDGDLIEISGTEGLVRIITTSDASDAEQSTLAETANSR